MVELGKGLFHCTNCNMVFEEKMKAWTVEFEGDVSYCCKLCDRKFDEEEASSHCNACRTKADNMKSVKDPDTKKKILVCDKCYDEIKR